VVALIAIRWPVLVADVDDAVTTASPVRETLPEIPSYFEIGNARRSGVHCGYVPPSNATTHGNRSKNAAARRGNIQVIGGDCNRNGAIPTRSPFALKFIAYDA